MLSAIMRLFSRNTGMFLIASASLLLLGGTCNMYYQNYADTRREFIRLSWLLGDWRHSSNRALPVMHWENREPDQYVGTLDCLSFKTFSDGTEEMLEMSVPLCEYQIVRQYGQIKFDVASRPPSGDIRFFSVNDASESISHESLSEFRELARSVVEFKDTTSLNWNSVRFVQLSRDTLLIATGTKVSLFEKYDTLIRVQ